MKKLSKTFVKGAWQLIIVASTPKKNVYTYEASDSFTRKVGEVIFHKDTRCVVFVKGPFKNWYKEEDFLN
jgi:hypothetical protein